MDMVTPIHTGNKALRFCSEHRLGLGSMSAIELKNTSRDLTIAAEVLQLRAAHMFSIIERIKGIG